CGCRGIEQRFHVVLELLRRDPRSLRHRKREEDPLLDEGNEVIEKTGARLAALLEEIELAALEFLGENEVEEAPLRGGSAAGGGVDSADESADARPQDQADRDLALFENLERTEVGQPPGCAAAQRE